MQHRLKRWWNVPALWPICFAVLFGLDVGSMNIDKPFDGANLLETLLLSDETEVVFPEMLPVITEMMKSGVKKTALAESLSSNENSNGSLKERLDQLTKPCMSLSKPVIQDIEGVSLLAAVIELLAVMHAKSQNFRDFAVEQNYVQALLRVLFPVVVSSDIVNADVELNSRDGLRLDELDLAIRPRSAGAAELRTKTVEQTGIRDGRRAQGPLRRGSSFILVSSDQGDHVPSSARIRHAFAPAHVKENEAATENPIVSSILGLILAVFTGQLLGRKDFSGLGLYLKTPPGFLEHQACFNSWLLRNLFSALQDAIATESQIFLEPRTLTNLGRLATHVSEAIYEGWFIDGAAATLELTGTILEYLQRPDVSMLKSVRLCNQAIASMRSTLFRAVLLKLSGADDQETLALLGRLSYWQAVLLSAAETQSEHLQLLCYLLYTKLVSKNEDVRRAAVSLWRIILVQKPDEMSAILNHATVPLQDRLLSDFEVLAGMEDTSFLGWVADREDDLNALFFGILSRSWERFVQEEGTSTDSSARSRVSKRQDKLKQWAQIEKLSEEVTRKHEVTFPHWISNISASEFLKYQRVLQDQQDDSMFMWSACSHLLMDLRRFGGVLAEDKERKWRLDQTEGRSRMRLRVVPDDSGERQDYQPKKRKVSEPPQIKIDTQVPPPSGRDALQPISQPPILPQPC